MSFGKAEQLELLEAIHDFAKSGENDRAHIREDALWRKTLEAIMNGAPDAAELAARALRSQHNTYRRWYA